MTGSRHAVAWSVLVAVAAGMLALAAPPAVAQRADLRTDWNSAPNPAALYGGCLPGDIGSAFLNKELLLAGAGRTLQRVLAITVLECRPFYESPYPWGTNIVPCPTGSPYALCLANGNDGSGNGVLLGVLKIGSRTDPNTRACVGGPDRVSLLIRAGEDPRLVNGIVTLGCGPADGPERVARVACPAGPSPYAYCLATRNDGHGHAVTLGVVAANGPGDPYGLYGECNIRRYGIADGFARKIDLVRNVSGNPDEVEGIDLFACNAPVGFGAWFPPTLEKTACEALSLPRRLARRYDYCIVGTDSRGNGVVAGVIATK